MLFVSDCTKLKQIAFSRTITVQIFLYVCSIKYLIIMATVNFLYRSTKQKANLSLRLLFRHDEKDFVFAANTKVEVSKEYWTKKHNQKRPKDIEIANEQNKTNNELNRIENFVLKAFNTVNPTSISKSWLKSQIDHYYNPPKQNIEIPKNLVNYIDYYIEYRKHELKEGLIKKIKVTKHKLERFELDRKKTILISDVNDNFKNEFVTYCKTEKYANNTTERDLAAIKTFCKHARFIGLETHHQLDNLRLEKEKALTIYLSFEELEKINAIDKEKLTESLENARDWLIISCYTGQRISDFMRFNKEMIRIEKDKPLIEFTQKKTGKIMTVPLHHKVVEILEKREGQFPYAISDQKYNDYIKDVCKIAKINQKVIGSRKTEIMPNSKIYRKEIGNFEKHELVTSHIGRRSFATNFYGKIPTMYLINVTGHSTEKMFLNYIGKSNKDLAMELINYF